MTAIGGGRLQPLFDPRSVAIVGASQNSSYFRALRHNLADYEGRVDLVNPRRRDVEQARCWPSLRELPAVPDHVLCITPAEAVPGVLADAVDLGARAVTIYSAGTRRTSLDDLPAQVSNAISDGTLLLCGPNCLGPLSTRSMFIGYGLPIRDDLRAGRVSTISHSGGSLAPWLRALAARGIGTRRAVSSGDELGTNTADYLEAFVEDEDTDLIVLQYLEATGDPERFVRAARAALAVGKPILAVAAARSAVGRLGVQTHTGRLAPPSRDLEAAARSVGITLFPAMDDLLEGVAAFSSPRRPAGPRVSVHAISGAVCNHFADLVAERAPELVMAEFSTATHDRLQDLVSEWAPVKNPLDSSWPGANSSDTYYNICQALAEDPDTDIVLLEGELPRASGAGPYRFVPHRLKQLAASRVPVFHVSRLPYWADAEAAGEMAASGVVFLQGAGRAAAAINALYTWCRTRAHILDETGTAPVSGARERLPAATDVLSHDRLAGYLAGFGLPVPKGVMIRPGSKLDGQLAWPVALKRIDLVHKSDSAAVALDIADEDALAAAATRLLAAAPAGADGPRLYAQEMVDGTWEIIVGGRSSEFGPILVVGVGGVWSEIVNDVAVRLAPVSRAEAAGMLHELRAWPALAADRRGQQADVEWLADAIAAFSHAVVDATGQGIAEIEANPVMVRSAGGGGSLVDIRAVRTV